jgi:hypothetical protein
MRLSGELGNSRVMKVARSMHEVSAQQISPVLGQRTKVFPTQVIVEHSCCEAPRASAVSTVTVRSPSLLLAVPAACGNGSNGPIIGESAHRGSRSEDPLGLKHMYDGRT